MKNPFDALQCKAAICVKERDFPHPYVFRCLKASDHPGDHYALDQKFEWVLRKIDGRKLVWSGRAEFLWRQDEVDVFTEHAGRQGLVVITVGTGRDLSLRPETQNPEPETTRRPADLTIWEYDQNVGTGRDLSLHDGETAH